MSEQIILVRHGETLHNVAGIAQGWADSELSDRGREQVRRLGERLRRHKCDALFASPLGLALTTATAIHDILGLEINVLEDLRERFAALSQHGRTGGSDHYEVPTTVPVIPFSAVP